MSKERTCSGHGSCELRTDADGNEMAGCLCEEGFFGAGCERVCPGKIPLSAQPVCNGHGVCAYYGKFEHCNGAPWTCGPMVHKRCVCNHPAGWYEYLNAGGTCSHAAPGAMRDAGPTGDWAAEGRSVCHAHGIPWDPKSGGKHWGKDRGSYMVTEDARTSSEGPFSACLYCHEHVRSGPAARHNGAGPDSCVAQARRGNVGVTW